MDYDLSVFAHADAWVSLVTLTFLEIVLGVDNIIFISIVASKLPKNSQKKARNIGLLVAMVFRVLLLLSITWIIGLTAPFFTLPFEGLFNAIGVENAKEAIEVSGRDLILLLGGFFLLAKSTTEIHEKVGGSQHEKNVGSMAKTAFGAVIAQIILIDIVFSFDSILTAVGLTPHVMVMIFAVILAMGVMMAFSGPISDIINRYPTLQMLALSFLIMIGLTLILEGINVHVNKSVVYIAILFSLGVELLNIRLRKKADIK
jgi:predicted tellurium resistance membrane protein TerC